MRVVTAIVGGLLVFGAVAMALLFFVGNAVEGLPATPRYAAYVGCVVVGLFAGAGSARASMARRP